MRVSCWCQCVGAREAAWTRQCMWHAFAHTAVSRRRLCLLSCCWRVQAAPLLRALQLSRLPKFQCTLTCCHKMSCASSAEGVPVDLLQDTDPICYSSSTSSIHICCLGCCRVRSCSLHLTTWLAKCGPHVAHPAQLPRCEQGSTPAATLDGQLHSSIGLAVLGWLIRVLVTL